MIDVWGVVSNGLWVIGLSVLLAAWSWARYAGYQSGSKTQDKLKEPPYTLATDLGLLLFVGGMAATEDRSWARLLWIALGLVVIAHGVLNLRGAKPDRPRED